MKTGGDRFDRFSVVHKLSSRRPSFLVNVEGARGISCFAWRCNVRCNKSISMHILSSSLLYKRHFHLVPVVACLRFLIYFFFVLLINTCQYRRVRKAEYDNFVPFLHHSRACRWRFTLGTVGSTQQLSLTTFFLSRPFSPLLLVFASNFFCLQQIFFIRNMWRFRIALPNKE